MLRPRAPTLLLLAAIVLAATGLRFWRLNQPPSWLDESVTALIAAGRGPDFLPLGTVVAMQRVAEMFNPQLTARTGDALAVFSDPRVQDLHPPTYHLLSNLALRVGLVPRWPLVARVRALAALFGVAAVIALFGVVRIAFDERTSLTAAALVAASPFAVMLSREARNYSCALLLVTCSVGAMLALARRIEENQPTALWWFAWVVGCTAGLYIHYFTLFATVAEAFLLGAVARRAGSYRARKGVAVASVAIVLLFAPWLPTLIRQQASPEQRWLTFALYGSSLLRVPYKIASAWQTMLLGKAWDLGQPTYEVSRAIALVLFLWVVYAVGRALLKTSRGSAEERAVRMLSTMTAVMVLEYVAATILQRKDFVSEVRYQYAYYVPLIIVVAWVFARRLPRAATLAIVAAGAINSVMVVFDVESWKGTDPQPVLARLEQASRPTLIVGGSASFNETVVYATVLNEYLRRFGPRDQFVAIVQRTPLYASFDIHADPAIFWKAVARLRPPVLPATLMVQSSGMRRDEYVPAVQVTTANGEVADCVGVGLDDPAFGADNTLIRPLYRRYVCTAAGNR